MAQATIRQPLRRASHFEPTRHHTPRPSLVKTDPALRAQDDSLTPWIGVAIVAVAALCGLALPWV
jgi:hypothetical protein